MKEGITKICVVKSIASNEELALFVLSVLDDDMDTSSYLTIEANRGEDVIEKVECTYHNGEGHEGEEGLCVDDSDSKYDDSKVHDFLEDLLNYIEEDMNLDVKQVSTMGYEYGRHGAHLSLRILLAKNVAKMVYLSPKIYCQSESAVIAVMRMNIMYARNLWNCV